VDEARLDNPAREAQARDIMRSLRCLVCQNQSIEDSNADLAADLRRIVRERVAAGDDAEAVRAYMVARYGDWVLLKPPFKPATLLLWAGPFLLLLAGALALLWRLRQHRAAAAAPLSPDEQARLDAALAALERGDLRRS
jgi:cytochrome c-type biogenesis protein CcmH